ncbi:MerR family transcriptional regulator [Sphingomonas sp. SRS2]|uniref:MerR family transcriptional regulator n=1 Tax=Sphingomonas sp. SRS2 TaxID=133190 RepID=UPI0006184F8C|nr:MerR family DNA-binding transcriptional regulator [Sphingomonas sp. SRS2]KKC26297.1 MerR family transcriptional regulator [Sphingomonas sp. SRS2]
MAKRALSGDDDRQPLRGIQDVATELGVTTRTIRFYEDKGLLEPQRVGTMRVYSRREIGRLQLILRGKRLGFSLRQIKEFLDLYDADSLHLSQTRRLLERVSERMSALVAQREAVDQTLHELQDIARQCHDRIAAAG